MWLGFEEIDGQAEGEIRREENAKRISFNPARPGHDRGQQQQKNDLVQRYRVPRYAVRDGNSPGQAGRVARRVVHGSGEEATDSADAHGGDGRQDQEVAGRTADADDPLDDFDADESSQQSADDRLAAEEIRRIADLTQRERRIAEPEQQARADRCAEGGAGENGGARVVADRVAAALPQDGVDGRGRDVSGDFESEVYRRVPGPIHAVDFACYAARMLRRIGLILVIAGGFASAMYTGFGCGSPEPPIASTTLRGTVTDAQNAVPIAGAAVSVVNAAGNGGASLLTDNAGRYETSITPGRARVTASKTSYQTFTTTIDVAANGTTLNIKLQPSS